MADPESKSGYKVQHDPEFEGDKMHHPYVWYVGGTLVLFLFLVAIAWLALDNGWIPQR
jgi:hypothetical protein